MARNDITGDSIANTKGSAEKYAQGWDRLFGKMVERNPEDDALFADMHARKRQFSLEAVAEAFKDVPRRVPASVMALDFHDSQPELKFSVECPQCHSPHSVYAWQIAVHCVKCGCDWEDW